MAAEITGETRQHDVSGRKSERPPLREESAQGEENWLRRQWQKRWVRYGAIAAAALLLVLGGLWYWFSRGTVSTNDAYIETHIVQVAPQVAGRVAHVYVRDNEAVKAGQVLVRLDPTQYAAQLDQAKAQLAEAKTQEASAEAAVTSAQATAKNAEQNEARYEKLHRTAPAAISQQTLDQAVASARTAEANVNAAQQKVAGAKAAIAVAAAAVKSAQLNANYTVVTAPMAGHIAQRSIARGDYVQPGEAMMALVPLKVWVTANFKETQLNAMHAGDPATIAIDACGGRTVKGRVVSIQRGAGQAFQILPPENATGNFVKVVQRVPVRIALNTLPKNCVLGPGMSVEPSVTVSG